MVCITPTNEFRNFTRKKQHPSRQGPHYLFPPPPWTARSCPLATSNRSPSSLSCHTLTDRSHPATPFRSPSVPASREPKRPVSLHSGRGNAASLLPRFVAGQRPAGKPGRWARARRSPQERSRRAPLLRGGGAPLQHLPVGSFPILRRVLFTAAYAGQSMVDIV